MSEATVGSGGFELNHDAEVEAMLDIPDNVYIVDSTIRSLQSSVSGSRHTAEELAEIGMALDRLGVREIIINISWADGLEVIKLLAARGLDAKIVATFRVQQPGGEDLLGAALESGADELCLESAPNVGYLERVAGLLRAKGMTASHAFAERHSWDEMIELSRAAARLDFRSLSFHDSYFRLGVTPEAMKVFIRRVRAQVPDHPALYVHLSNFYGQATMTAVAAVTAGANAIDACLNQTGHHCGHISMGEAALVLEDLYDIRTGLDLSAITSTANLVAARTGIPVKVNQPIIGDLAFMIDGADWAAEAHLPYQDRMHSRLPFEPDIVGARQRVIWNTRTASDEAIATKLASMDLPNDERAARRARTLLEQQLSRMTSFPQVLSDEEFEKLLLSHLASQPRTH